MKIRIDNPFVLVVVAFGATASVLGATRASAQMTRITENDSFAVSCGVAPSAPARIFEKVRCR